VHCIEVKVWSNGMQYRTCPSHKALFIYERSDILKATLSFSKDKNKTQFLIRECPDSNIGPRIVKREIQNCFKKIWQNSGTK